MAAYSSKVPIVLGVVTLFTLVAHVVSAGHLGEVDLFSYFIVLLYLAVFLTSFYFFVFIFSAHLRGRSQPVYTHYTGNKFTRVVFAAVLVSYLLMYAYLVGSDYSSFIELRNNLIGMYRNEETSFDFKILNTLGLLLFYFASYLYLEGKSHGAFYVISALTFPLLMGNRNYLLIFFLFVIFKLFSIQKKRYYIVLLFLVFFAFNMLYVYLFDKGREGINIITSTAISVFEYATVPLHGLSYSLANPQNYGDYLSFPSALVAWMGFDVNRDFMYTPDPHVTNVYTLFFSLIYDFGVLGVVFFATTFAAFHAYLYAKSKTSDLFLFVYIYSFYPLIMTFFDNVYTTSVGGWVYMFLPFLFMKKVRLLGVYEKSALTSDSVKHSQVFVRPWRHGALV